MKLTQRDKMLLLVLVILLAVALAVVFPGIGVLACNEKINDTESKSKELNSQLDEAFAELNAMGIDSKDIAENASAAMTRLENTIWDMKEEASRLAGSIMAYADPYAVDSEWVEGLEYRFGVKADNVEKIVEYAPIEGVQAEDNGKDTEIDVGEEETVFLPTAKRTITFTVTENADCYYVTDYTNENEMMREMGAALLYLQHIASKGSMLIEDFTYNMDEANPPKVTFTLFMPPENSGISEYAKEIEEYLLQQAEGQPTD